MLRQACLYKVSAIGYRADVDVPKLAHDDDDEDDEEDDKDERVPSESLTNCRSDHSASVG